MDPVKSTPNWTQHDAVDVMYVDEIYVSLRPLTLIDHKTSPSINKLHDLVCELQHLESPWLSS